ncbi:ADP/ATP translocase 1 [Candidatus Rubidus massiliensis]|nr:ADP/ATP translocase 1 [Candidatus Rubidus massiliensis]
MSGLNSGNSDFAKWRGYFWPVHRYELRKLIPMLLIFFFISFDYNILRVMKDTVVITAKNSGAEVIPFIKVWVMFPSAILMTWMFTRLSNRFSRDRVFYSMVSFFLSYYFIFIFFLYPNRDWFHPNESADALQTILPQGFKGLIAMYRNWTFTIFYVMSEMWSSIVLSVLFWGFANQITRLDEAKRFYGLFGIGANLSGIAAGQASVYLSRHVFNPSLPFGKDAWEQSMGMIIIVVTLAGIAAMFVYRWMTHNILNDTRFYEEVQAQDEKKLKGNLSLRNAFSYLLKSRYLFCIALIVISYNLVINILEVIWKHQVRELYPNPGEYSIYMNQVTTVIGICSTFAALFISGNSIRSFGWTFTALLTPALLFITSVGFFAFFFLKGFFNDQITAAIGASPLVLVVFFGSIQNIVSRAAKYSVFDATKEMAFVPLSSEWKLKGKAAIDGVCSRLGKSGGSIVHQFLLLLFSSISASAPYAAAFLFAVIGVWISATKLLGNQFAEISSTSTSKAAETKTSLQEA